MPSSVAQARLVIVAGAPATGKTTLARRLGGDLDAVLILKDDIKEALADALGTGDRAWSRRLGRATYAVLYLVTARAVAAHARVILEANFYRSGEDELRSAAAGADARIVLCRTDAATRRARFTGRGGRHPIHLDGEIVEHEWNDDDAEFAIDIGVPRLTVDTTDGYSPAWPEIEAFARG